MSKALGVLVAAVTAAAPVHSTHAKHQAKLRHRWHMQHPLQGAVASWYSEEATASGYHATYGIANKELPFGTKVRLCHRGCVLAVVDDRGPFIAGRTFDLRPAAKEAIGCSDLCDVHWRLAWPGSRY